MAASVEGYFRIIDRASGPMRSMERQALKTDAAIKKLGMTLDGVGSTKHVRQLENVDRQMRTLDRDNDKVARSMRKMEQEGGRVERMFRKILIVGGGLGKVFTALKLPVLATGFALVAKAIAPLVGGITALVPKLVGATGAIATMLPAVGRLGGALGALPATITGVGLAMVTVKLATKDLSQAFGGNQQALKRLTPEARQFLTVLKSYQPALNTLKASAQGGLFGGLTDALKRGRTALPYINELIQDMSSRLGNLARLGAQRFTQRGFLQDFLALGHQGGRIVTTLGRSLIRLIDTFRNIGVAAMPFTEWLRKTVDSWSRYIDVASRVNRQNGRMAAFFERTRKTLVVFGHIARDLFFALKNIADAMRSTGDSMWKGLERTAKAFRDFTSSVSGQARMRLWFAQARRDFTDITHILGNLWNILKGIGGAARTTGDSLWGSFSKATDGWNKLVNSFRGQLVLRRFFSDMRATFEELMGLLKDLGVGLIAVGTNQRGFPALIHSLRGVLPPLEKVIDLIARSFGPPVVSALENIAQILGNLTGATGPLTIFLNLLNGVLGAINAVIGHFRAAGAVISAALTIIGINIFIGKVRSLASSWFGVATAANAAAGAEARAMGMGGGCGGFIPWGGGGMGRGGRGRPTPGMFGMTPAGGRRPGGFFTRMRGGLGARLGRLGIGGGEGLALGALARGGLAAAGRFIWPIAALGGLFGAATAPREGNFGMQLAQTGAGFLSGASFGLIPRIRTGSEQAVGRFNRAIEGYDERVGEGWRLRRPEQGGAGGYAYSQGRMVHHAGMQEMLGRWGGMNPRTAHQQAMQIQVVAHFARMLKGVNSAAAREQRANLIGEINARQGVLAQMRAQEREARKIRAARRAERGRQGARDLLVDLGERFNVIEAARGRAAAYEDLNRRVAARMRHMRGPGRMLLAQRLLGWANKNAPRQEMQEIESVIKGEFQRTGQNIEIVHNRIYTGSKKSWNNIRKAMTSEAEKARQEVSTKFTWLQQAAVGQLKSMGYTQAQARAIVAGMEAGGTGPNTTQMTQQSYGGAAAAHHYGGLAGGGRIRGSGRQDTVPVAPGVMAAPGELVVNRHQEAAANRMLGMFGHTLGGIVEKINRPHYMAHGGRTGGPGLQAGITKIGEAVLGRFPGLSITSTTSGTHAKNSYHYRGMAEDIGGPPALMNQAANWIMSSGLYSQLLEGIHNPGLSVKNGQQVPSSFWGARTWAGHMDHLHLAAGAVGALTGLGGAAAQLLGALPIPPTRLGGVPGAMSHAAGRAMAQGLRGKINQRILAMGGALGADTAGPGRVRGSYNKAQLMSLASSVGFPNPNLAAAVALAESSGNPNARNVNTNGSIDRGLWQINSIHGALSTFNPNANARAAFQISGGGSNWRPWVTYNTGAYKRFLEGGGRIPWLGAGADFIARRPQVIGVGDGGPERVQVTPVGRGGGHSINVGPFHITNNRPGDIRRAIEGEVTDAVLSLARKLEVQSSVGESR